VTRTVLRPYLVTKGEDGKFRVTVRSTRFNSQGYPLVQSHVLEEEFPSAARAIVAARRAPCRAGRHRHEVMLGRAVIGLPVGRSAAGCRRCLEGMPMTHSSIFCRTQEALQNSRAAETNLSNVRSIAMAAAAAWRAEAEQAERREARRAEQNAPTHSAAGTARA